MRGTRRVEGGSGALDGSRALGCERDGGVAGRCRLTLLEGPVERAESQGVGEGLLALADLVAGVDVEEPDRLEQLAGALAQGELDARCRDGGVDDDTDHVAFFQAGGLILALWDRGKLAADSGVEDRGGWGGVTLAYNVRSPEEVDAVLAEARAAGATIPRSGAPTFWGGYSGVFIDPDGHPWEVAHNPGWTVHDDGRTTLD